MKSFAVIIIICSAYFAVPDLHKRMLAVSNMRGILSEQSISEQSISEQSISERSLYWKQAYLMFKTHPVFGVGFGRFGKSLSPEAKTELTKGTLLNIAMAHAHNSYLQILAETGIVGLALFIAFFIFFLKAIWLKIIVLPEGSFIYAVALSVFVNTVASLLASMADYNLGSPTIMMPLMALGGIVLLAKEPSDVLLCKDIQL